MTHLCNSYSSLAPRVPLVWISRVKPFRPKEWQGNVASVAEPRAHTAEARRFAERAGAAGAAIDYE
jgi:hypothetical protein